MIFYNCSNKFSLNVKKKKKKKKSLFFFLNPHVSWPKNVSEWSNASDKNGKHKLFAS